MILAHKEVNQQHGALLTSDPTHPCLGPSRPLQIRLTIPVTRLRLKAHLSPSAININDCVKFHVDDCVKHLQPFPSGESFQSALFILSNQDWSASPYCNCRCYYSGKNTCRAITAHSLLLKLPTMVGSG